MVSKCEPFCPRGEGAGRPPIGIERRATPSSVPSGSVISGAISLPVERHRSLQPLRRAPQVVDGAQREIRGNVATELQAALENTGAKPRVVHDYGSEFINRDVAAAIKAHNLIDIKTKPRHRESNGIVERFNSTVRAASRGACAANRCGPCAPQINQPAAICPA
jgi:transposase InsO family protein